MVEYQKDIDSSSPNQRQAIQSLQEVERYFPTREHPCHGFAKAMLADMDVL